MYDGTAGATEARPFFPGVTAEDGRGALAAELSTSFFLIAAGFPARTLADEADFLMLRLEVLLELFSSMLPLDERAGLDSDCVRFFVELLGAALRADSGNCSGAADAAAMVALRMSLCDCMLASSAVMALTSAVSGGGCCRRLADARPSKHASSSCCASRFTRSACATSSVHTRACSFAASASLSASLTLFFLLLPAAVCLLCAMAFSTRVPN